MGSPSTDRELVRRGGFAKFCQLAWEHVPQETHCVWEPHMQLICDHYEATLRGEILDLVVNVPPGMSKTVITSILLQAFDWGPNGHPERKYIFASYSEDLVTRDAGRCRDLMLGDWYQQRWGQPAGGFTLVDGAKAAKTYYTNDKDGSRFSTTMRGQVTGFHGHILVCDDPLKPSDIQTGGDEAREKLEKCNELWDQTFSSRSADPATFRRIVIMQRLHYNDLAGQMLARGAQALVLPMEFEPERAYESRWGSDWRQEPGELLAPKRFPQHAVEKRRDGITMRNWVTQYQHRPSPEEGGTFQKEFFARRWTVLPPMSKTVISVDATLKETARSDFFVAQVQGMRSATEMYLIDQLRRRAGFFDGIEMIVQLKKKWPTVSTILVEEKANGAAIVEALKRKFTGVVAVNPSGGKEARANAVEPLYRSNILWPDDRLAPWMYEYISEHLAFPFGGHDDQVDASTQGFGWLSGKTGSSRFKTAMAAARKNGMRLR